VWFGGIFQILTTPGRRGGGGRDGSSVDLIIYPTPRPPGGLGTPCGGEEEWGSRKILAKIHFGFLAPAGRGGVAGVICQKSYSGLFGRSETNGFCRLFQIFTTPCRNKWLWGAEALEALRPPCRKSTPSLPLLTKKPATGSPSPAQNIFFILR